MLNMKIKNYTRKFITWMNKPLIHKNRILRIAIPNGILLSATLIIVAAGLLIVGFRPTSSKQNVQQKPTDNKTTSVSTKTKVSTPVTPSTSASSSNEFSCIVFDFHIQHR